MNNLCVCMLYSGKLQEVWYYVIRLHSIDSLCRPFHYWSPWWILPLLKSHLRVDLLSLI